MPRRQAPKRYRAALAAGLALAGPAVVQAQVDPNQANLSTGSGAGTSPGIGPGSSPSSTRIGRGSLLGGPMDDYLPPRIPDSELPMVPVDPAQIDAMDGQLLGQARLVVNPAERAMALERVARSKILGAGALTGIDRPASRISCFRRSSRKATRSSSRPARRPSRPRPASSATSGFGRSSWPTSSSKPRKRSPPGAGRIPARAGTRLDQTGREIQPVVPPVRDYKDRAPWFDRSMADYRRGAFLARQLENANYRSDLLFRLAESESGQSGSQSIVSTAALADTNRRDLQGQTTELYRVADRTLVQSYNITRLIDLNIWRDRALLAVVTAASASEQYARALQIASVIPQPEYRADALVRLAEAQARRNWSSDATSTYAAAARAVASIPQEDPRTIQTNVLIDSLISVGRFDDARRSIIFYPGERKRRLAPLGAIAMSQGERGLANVARVWIDREAPQTWRSILHRKVDDGLIAAIERTRSRGSFFSPGLEQIGRNEAILRGERGA